MNPVTKMNTHRMIVIANFLLFQLAWFACVIGGANEMPWVGPVFVLVFVVIHLWLSTHPGIATNPIAECKLLVCAAVIGVLVDSLLVTTGWVSYPSGQFHSLFAPYWIVAMWVAFATTLNTSLAWLKKSIPVAVLFGAIGGPLAYLAGMKLGGIMILHPVLAYSYLALVWAIATPLMLSLATRFIEPGPTVTQTLTGME